MQVARGDDASIRRHHVTCGEPNDIALYDVSPRKLTPRVVSKHCRRRRNLVLERPCGSVRAVSLYELHEHAHGDDHQDDRGVSEVAQGCGRRTRENQDGDERIRESPEELRQP